MRSRRARSRPGRVLPAHAPAGAPPVPSHARAGLRARPRPVGATPPGRRSRRRSPRRRQSLLVVMPLGGDHHGRARPDVEAGEVERGAHDDPVGMMGGPVLVVDDGRPPTEHPGQRDQGADGRGAADHHDVRRRQHRLQVDLERALTLAGHRHRDHPFPGPAVQLVGRAEEHQPRVTVLQRLLRLPHHGRLRAGPAQPPHDRAVGEDQGLVPLLARRRATSPHHGGQHEGVPPAPGVGGEFEHGARTHRLGPGLSAAPRAAPWPAGWPPTPGWTSPASPRCAPRGGRGRPRPR